MRSKQNKFSPFWVYSKWNKLNSKKLKKLKKSSNYFAWMKIVYTFVLTKLLNKIVKCF